MRFLFNTFGLHYFTL